MIVRFQLGKRSLWALASISGPVENVTARVKAIYPDAQLVHYHQRIEVYAYAGNSTSLGTIIVAPGNTAKFHVAG